MSSILQEEPPSLPESGPVSDTQLPHPSPTPPLSDTSSASQVALVEKNPPVKAGDIRDVDSTPHRGREDPLEKEMAIHSDILAWRVPWTEEPGGLQSMGSPKSQTQWKQLSTAPTTSSFSLPGGQLLSLASENMALMGTSRGQAFGQISSPGAVTGRAQH